jgi:hypothetical protein
MTIPLSQRPVIDLPVKDIKVHRCNRALPRWSTESDEWAAFCQDILKHGVVEPILVVDRKWVAGGATRLKAADEVGLKTIPAREITEAEVTSCIFRDWHRQPRTKTQLAYLIASDKELVGAALAEGKRRRAENLNEHGGEGTNGAVTADELAAQNGISSRLLRQARKVVDYFKSGEGRTFTFEGQGEPLSLREFFEPRILSIEEPMGFKEVLCAAGFLLNQKSDHGGRFTIEQPRRLELWSETFAVVVARLSTWLTADDIQRRSHLRAVKDQVESLDAPKRTALADYYKQLAALCRAADS